MSWLLLDIYILMLLQGKTVGTYTAGRIWPISRSFLFSSSCFMTEVIKFQKRIGKQTGFSREVNSTITRTLFQARHKKQSLRTIKIIFQMTGNNRLHIVYIFTCAFYRLSWVQHMRLKFNVKVVIPDFKVIIICLIYLSSETKLCKTM